MTKRYAVHNLRCAGCAARIEDAIAGLPGVKSAAINLDSARLRVEGEQPELAAMIRLAFLSYIGPQKAIPTCSCR